MTTIDELYAGPWGKHPLDQLQPDAFMQAAEWGLLRDLHGELFVITGTLSMPRNKVQQIIEAAGGRFTNSVPGASARYTLVTGGSSASNTRKRQAAIAAGHPVITEAELVERLLPSPEELDGARWAGPRRGWW